MRVVVAAPPEAGGAWITCVLGSLYGLEPLVGASAPQGADAESFREWASRGRFRDGTILHRNYRYSPELVDAVEAVPAQVVTIVRNPYELFVSVFLAAQEQRSARMSDPRRPRPAATTRPRATDVLSGKPIGDAVVLDYLARGFRSYPVKAAEWLDSGRAVMLRHEGLIADPVAEVAAAAERLAPVDAARIVRSVEQCGTSDLRRIEDAGSGPDSVSAVGGARGGIADAHLRVMRTRYGDVIERLGYDVLAPSDDVADEPSDRPGQEWRTRTDDTLIPPAERVRWSYARRGGRENFARVGDEAVQRFIDECGLRPDERVLDVGSGVGRTAVALTKYLADRGQYEGFDVDVEGVTWCRENITPRFPNFRFQVADVYNKHYHPEGAQPASAYRFPYEDASFSFVFLWSIFTHLVPADLENYLRQIARVLQPGGRCFITMFLLNDASRRDLAAGTSGRAFPFDKGVYRVANEEFPERAVAYDEAYVRQCFADRGLAIAEPIRYGGWSRTPVGQPGRQDAIIAVKTG